VLVQNAERHRDHGQGAETGQDQAEVAAAVGLGLGRELFAGTGSPMGHGYSEAGQAGAAPALDPPGDHGVGAKLSVSCRHLASPVRCWDVEKQLAREPQLVRPHAVPRGASPMLVGVAAGRVEDRVVIALVGLV
jgi:hypothetical protein